MADGARPDWLPWVVGATVILAALVPVFAVARPANEIPVHGAPGEADALADPASQEWEEAPSARVSLTSAPSSVPDAASTSVDHVEVQAARTDDRLLLRLTWPDGTNDSFDGSPRAFADAVAVQMPVDTDAQPAIAMGSTRNLVNVWYWRASTGGEELLAGGPGTTTQFGDASLDARATHADGEWHVVLSRPLSADAANRTSIDPDEDLDVALAVWNGSNMERSGRKSVSEWHYLAMGAGPQGPPYETILWVVAGLAILVTILMTVDAVRRT